MEQTWTVVGVPTNARITEDISGFPTNARITEDISGWERACDKIIEAKGCIVRDENFRDARRGGP